MSPKNAFNPIANIALHVLCKLEQGMWDMCWPGSLNHPQIELKNIYFATCALLVTNSIYFVKK